MSIALEYPESRTSTPDEDSIAPQHWMDKVNGMCVVLGKKLKTDYSNRSTTLWAFDFNEATIHTFSGAPEIEYGKIFGVTILNKVALGHRTVSSPYSPSIALSGWDHTADNWHFINNNMTIVRRNDPYTDHLRIQIAASSFCNELSARIEDNIQEASNYLHFAIDGYLESDDLQICERIFEIINISSLPNTLLAGLLIATDSHKDAIRNRSSLYDKIEQQLVGSNASDQVLNLIRRFK